VTEMDRRIRITAAVGVLLAGTLLALAFRRDASKPSLALPPGGEPLVLRKPSISGVQSNPIDPAGGGSTVTAPASPAPRGAGQGPVLLTPQKRGAAPPDLLQSYPPLETQSSRWGTSLGMALPEVARPLPPRTRKVVDGDTLEGLAELYLGSPQRAAELWDMNREVLGNPRLLPIGAELKIPPREGPQ
jgi:nucleoid-associated protein YgaU